MLGRREIEFFSGLRFSLVGGCLTKKLREMIWAARQCFLGSLLIPLIDTE